MALNYTAAPTQSEFISCAIIRSVNLLVLLFTFLLQGCGEDIAGTDPSANTDGNTPNVIISTNGDIAVGIQVSLSASATDPNGDSLSYLWVISSSPANSSSEILNPNILAAQFTPDVEGSYTISLTVTDGINSALKSVNLHALTNNIAPTANIAPVPVVAPNSTVQLDGSNSYDPNNDALTYIWSFISIPNGSQTSFNNANISNPNFTADISGEYLVNLRVNDGQYNSIDTTAAIVASAYSLTVSWNPNSDSPPGYAVYIGPTLETANNLVKVLIESKPDWNPASPSIILGGEEILNNLPENSSQACFAVKAYNGVGSSTASAVTCTQLP